MKFAGKQEVLYTYTSTNEQILINITTYKIQ